MHRPPAMPVAMMRRVPPMRESPMPARGPMRATFIELIEEVSNSSLLAFSSSMAQTIPPMRGCMVVWQL